MPVKFNVEKPETEENAILGEVKETAKKVKDVTLSDNTVFKYVNKNTGTEMHFIWGQLKHMVSKEIAIDIAKKKSFDNSDIKITLA